MRLGEGGEPAKSPKVTAAWDVSTPAVSATDVRAGGAAPRSDFERGQPPRRGRRAAYNEDKMPCMVVISCCWLVMMDRASATVAGY
jgi:hypothetical protein